MKISKENNLLITAAINVTLQELMKDEENDDQESRLDNDYIQLVNVYLEDVLGRDSEAILRSFKRLVSKQCQRAM